MRNVVVRPPVSSAFSVGELVDEVTIVLTRQPLGFGVDLRRILPQMALAAVELDLRDFLSGRGCRHHCNKRYTQQTGEVRFGNGRRTARRFDHRRAGLEPAVAQRVQKQRSRQTVFEAAGGMARLVLEIQFDAREARQRQRNQVRIGAALKVGFNNPDGFAGPLSVVVHVFSR